MISLLPKHEDFLFLCILWLYLFTSLIHCLDRLFKRLLSVPSALEEIKFLYSALMKHKLKSQWLLQQYKDNLCVRLICTAKSYYSFSNRHTWSLFIQFTFFLEITGFIIDHRNEKHILHSKAQQQPSYLTVMKSGRLSQNSRAWWNSSVIKCVHLFYVIHLLYLIDP